MNSRITESLYGSSRLALVCGILGCNGYQASYRAEPTPMMEKSFVAPSFDSRDTMLYEAQFVVPLFLIDELRDQEDSLRVASKPLSRRAQRLTVVPLFRIRQLSDSSAAVRTPSFSPSVRFERHFLEGKAHGVPLPHSTNRELSAIVDNGFRIEWTHHSNGQAGCFRAGYVPDATGDPDNCKPGAAPDLTGVGLNRANGDFSTTYWGFSLFRRHLWLDTLTQQETRSFAISAGYQLHRFGLFGDMRPEQRALYGTHRVRVDASYAQVWGAFQGRVDGQLELAERTDPRITPWRAIVDVSLRSTYTLGAGIIVRYMDGTILASRSGDRAFSLGC